MLFRSNDTAYEILFSDWSSDVCSSDLASLGLSSRAQWLRFTLEELKYVLGEANLEILWFDNRQLELGVKSRQLDFILADADEFALAQSTGYYEASASFLPNAAIRAEDAQAAVIFTRRGRESTAFSALANPSTTFAATSQIGRAHV